LIDAGRRRHFWSDFITHATLQIFHAASRLYRRFHAAMMPSRRHATLILIPEILLYVFYAIYTPMSGLRLLLYRHATAYYDTAIQIFAATLPAPFVAASFHAAFTYEG